MATEPSIEVRHLRKVYGEIVAVDDLTFGVAPGAAKAIAAAQIWGIDGVKALSRKPSFQPLQSCRTLIVKDDLLMTFA